MSTNTTLPVYRIRNCRRATAYDLNKVPYSDKQASRYSVAGEIQRAMKPVVLANLAENGWTLDNQDTEFSYPDFLPDLTIKGRADAIGYHERFTKNLPTIIQVYAAPDSSIRNAQRHNLTSVPTSVEARAALLHRCPDPLERTNQDAPAIIATLNMDERQVAVDLLLPFQSDSFNDETKMWLMSVPTQPVDTDDMPNPDYEPSSWECRRCPWLTLCHGDPQEEVKLDPETPVADQLTELLVDYEKAYRDARPHSEAEKIRKKKLDTIKDVMRENQLTSFTNPDVTDSSIAYSSSPKDELDMPALKQLLTENQLHQVTKISSTSRINITVK